MPAKIAANNKGLPSKNSYHWWRLPAKMSLSPKMPIKVTKKIRLYKSIAGNMCQCGFLFAFWRKHFPASFVEVPANFVEPWSWPPFLLLPPPPLLTADEWWYIHLSCSTLPYLVATPSLTADDISPGLLYSSIARREWVYSKEFQCCISNCGMVSNPWPTNTLSQSCPWLIVVSNSNCAKTKLTPWMFKS